jgi:hypothetical protein
MGRNHKALPDEMLNRPHYKRIRNIWYCMKHRVSNPDNIGYMRYGGRGITICERWMILENFYADVVAGYEPGLSLERIDNSGDYCPENIKWANKKEQANNRRTSRMITANGVTKTLAQWSESQNIKRTTIMARMHVLGWPPEKAVGLVREY